MTRHLRPLFRTLLCASLVAWLGCAGLVGDSEPTVTEAERQAYGRALARLSDDPKDAERQLDQFVNRWPTSPLSADASFKLGQLAEARGDDDEARGRYQWVVRQFPRNENVDRARLRVAVLELERGNTAMATRSIARTRLRSLSDADRHVAHRVLAATASDPVMKVRWLSAFRAGESQPGEIAEIDADIDDALASLDAKGLAKVAEQTRPNIPAARALLAAAERALDQKAFDIARANIERASSLPIANAYASRLALANDRLRSLESGTETLGELPSFEEAAAQGVPVTVAARGAVGVVLPLSGRFASFGEETLRGILLAAGSFDATRPVERRPFVKLVIRDSKGDPALAAAHVRELAAMRVSAVIGPLLSDECESAAAAAELAGVPLLALTTRDSVAHDRAFAFRVRTQPRDEIRVLASHVTQDLGVKRFGILYPRDAYGRGLSALFWDAVEERGGEVVALASYDPDSVDFGDAIRRLIGYELLTESEKAAIKEREKIIRGARRLPAEEASKVREEARAMLGPQGQRLPPIVDFEALFIPESHEKVVLIAPQLAYHEATGITLLGSDAWNHPELVSIARNHVEGAEFTANFYANSSVEFVRDFAIRYHETFGTQADDLSAQAYDAANLVLIQLARGTSAPSAVRDGLLSTQGYPGVSGVLSMRSDGNARKRPFLLGIKRGRVFQLD